MPKLYKVDSVYLFYCSGCQQSHPIDERWEFNGDLNSPTFTPSLLVYPHTNQPRCHTFITNGRIQYLDDCEHELAGQTVDLLEWKEEYW